MLRTFAYILMGSLFALSSAAESDAEAVERLRGGATTGPLFWSQDDREVGFRNMGKIAYAREVSAGGQVYALPSAAVSLDSVTYDVEGDVFPLSHLLSDRALRGMIVVHDDRVLFEHYAIGMNPSSVWVSFSVTKSVTSMLIGAAIKDGYIESVDEPVVNYLPRLRGTSYEQATIRNVLNMASGVRWDETYSDPESDVAKAGGLNGINLVQYLATLPVETEPGEKFNYNTGETNLVGEILRAAIGNNASTYLTHKIWQPFGMESDAYWMLDGPGGVELGGCCINATLRDYARIGLFAMHGGQLSDGTQVLPEGWMAESTEPSKGYEGYGYLWWLHGDRGYQAMGIFEQRIRIFPDDNLVIAVHGNAEAAVGTEFDKHLNAALEAIRNHLVD